MSKERPTKKARLESPPPPTDFSDVPEQTFHLDPDVRCFERMAKVMDNRHDFKPDARNQSINLNTVMNILNVYFGKIRNLKPEGKPEYKTIYNELIKIHCADYNNSCKITPTNIDELAKEQFEAFFNKFYSLSEPTPVIRWSEFRQPENTNVNHVMVTIGSKEDLLKLLPSAKSPKNPFLETLMPKLSLLLKTDSNQINFVIDTCALSELAFTTLLNKELEKEVQTDPSQPYSRIYIGPGTDLDIFNEAKPSPGTTRYVIPYSTNTEESKDSETNHLVLKKFKTKEAKWQWWTSDTLNGVIQFDRQQATIRFGVSKFADLIKQSMNQRNKDIVLLNEFKKLTGLDYSESISKVDYGRHIFDFKRLMDSSQIIYTWYLNQLAQDPNQPIYGKKFVFITIDYMASCIARLLGVPTILTRSNPDRGFIIHIQSQLSEADKLKFQAEVMKKNKQDHALFMKSIQTLKQEMQSYQPILLNHLELIDLTILYEKEKRNRFLQIPLKSLLLQLLNYFKHFLIRSLNLLHSYTLLNPSVEDFTEEYRAKHRIFLIDGMTTEYQHLKHLYDQFQKLESDFLSITKKEVDFLQLWLNTFVPLSTSLIYFKLDPFIELFSCILLSINLHYKNPNYYKLVIRKPPRGFDRFDHIYQQTTNMTKQDLNHYNRWMNTLSHLEHTINLMSPSLTSHPIDVSVQELEPLTNDTFQELKSYAINIIEKKGGNPSNSKSSNGSPMVSENKTDVVPSPGSPELVLGTPIQEEKIPIAYDPSQSPPRSPSPAPPTQSPIKSPSPAPPTKSPIRSPSPAPPTKLTIPELYKRYHKQYGIIPWKKMSSLRDFNKFIDQAVKADLVRWLGQSIIKKQKIRLQYEYLDIMRDLKNESTYVVNKQGRPHSWIPRETKFLTRFIKSLSDLKT